MSERRRSKGIPEEEIVPRGREIYERLVRPKLRSQDEGKFVVIDVQGGRLRHRRRRGSSILQSLREGNP